MLTWLKRLFGRSQPATAEETAPLSEAEIEAAIAPPSPAIQPLQMMAGSGLSPGRQREHNEDALYMLNTVLAEDNRELPFGIFIVADGMGGHQHGERASAVAARTLARHILQHLYHPFLDYPPASPEASLQEVMSQGILKANQAVLEQVPGGGSTISAVVVVGEQMVIGHVGDSRVTLVHPEGRIETLTRDHSLVQRLVELEQLTPDEAAVHPQRSVLYRALGQSEPFTPDVLIRPFPQHSTVMICSDGLWSVVPEEEIVAILQKELPLPLACAQLVQAANDAGGPDNISVILVKRAR